MRLRSGAILAAASFVLAACGGDADYAEGDWRGQMKEVRMAVRGSEDDPMITRRLNAYKDYIRKATGLTVKLFESADYNGTIQALSSGQVDIATMGGASYANVDAQIGELAAPILAIRQAEGEMGYYSVLLVKADSPYQSIQDLRGKVLGYVDFNSTSGYLFPRAAMRAEGVDPDRFFSKSSFSGGHTQAVMALENGQFDAVIVSAGGGTPQSGFTTGAHYTMARRGVVDLDDFRIIWAAGPMPNSPVVVRADRPQPFIDAVRGAMAALAFDDPEVWRDIGQPDGAVYAAVNRGTFKQVIDLRAEDIAARRNGER